MELDITEFNKLAAESPEVIDAIFQKFILMAEEGTQGGAAEMAGTLSGMMSTAKDIIEVGSRNLFRPIIEAVSPTIASVLDPLSDFATGPEIVALGERIGVGVTKGIEAIKGFVAGFKEEGLFIGVENLFSALDIEPPTWLWDILNAVVQFVGVLQSGQGVFAAVVEILDDFLPEETIARIWRMADAAQALGQWITGTAIPTLREWGQVFITDMLPQIREFATEGLGWLMEKGAVAWTWITETAIPTLKEWGEVFKTDVLPKVNDFRLNVLVPLWEKGQEIWAWIADTAIPKLREWGLAFQEGFSPFGEQVMPWLRVFYEDILPRLEVSLASLRGLWDQLKESWGRILAAYEENLAPAFANLAEALGINIQKGGSFAELLGQIAGATFWASLEGLLMIITAGVEALTVVIDIASLAIEGWTVAFEGISAVMGTVIDQIANLITGFENLTGVNLPDWLTPGSPTSFEIGLRGIASAIRGMPDLSAGLSSVGPQFAGAGAGGGSITNNRSDVSFYGPVTVPGVQDAPSFLEQLTRLAD